MSRFTNTGVTDWLSTKVRGEIAPATTFIAISTSAFSSSSPLAIARANSALGPLARVRIHRTTSARTSGSSPAVRSVFRTPRPTGESPHAAAARANASTSERSEPVSGSGASWPIAWSTAAPMSARFVGHRR